MVDNIQKDFINWPLVTVCRESLRSANNRILFRSVGVSYLYELRISVCFSELGQS